MEGLLLLTTLFGAAQQCGVAGKIHSWVPANFGTFRGKNCLSGTIKAFSPLENASHGSVVGEGRASRGVGTP